MCDDFLKFNKYYFYITNKQSLFFYCLLVKKISIWGGGGAEIFEKRDFFREICLENQTLHLRTWERFVSKKKSRSADVGEICEKKKERFFKISLTAEGPESLFRDKKSLFCKKSRTPDQAIIIIA